MKNRIDENYDGFDNNRDLNLREEIEKYIFHWKWLLLGVVLAILFAFLYLRYSTPLYNAKASILIKDNKKSGISQELEAFKDLGIIGGGSSNNTDNEIEILRSRSIIGNVVDSLNLTESYFVQGRVKYKEIFNNKPLKIELFKKSSFLEKRDTIFLISYKDTINFVIKNIEGEKLSKHKFGDTIFSKIGVFNIKRQKNSSVNDGVYIKLSRRSEIIDMYRKNLIITPVNKNSSVLILSLKDKVQKKAELILDELVRQYNIDAINDKSEVSNKTRDFIDERLTKVYLDLAVIQDDVKNFKTKNKISGLSKEGELALEQVSNNFERLTKVKNQITLSEWIQKSLNLNKIEILPQNLGFMDNGISSSIEKYNELVLAKNRLEVNAGKNNPYLIQYVSEIQLLKSNLKRSVSNYTYSLKTELKSLKKSASITNSKVSAIPILERRYIDIARQQEIISNLYSYLLKKKEETAISLAVTVPNAKIIDKAYSSNIPVSPKKMVVYLLSIFLGILVPFIIIYLKNLLDTKVHNKKDIEDILTVPFLGDIPKSESKEKIIAGKDDRSSSSEAFRLVKTNLDFMLANNSKTSKFIFITSTTSGEGKSFISINLAATLAQSGKRVLLMGMDLRAPKVTEYLGLESKKGVTNYITNKNLSLDDIKFNIDGVDNLDIISSGAIPPNPAELLVSKSVENLFDEVKNYYYYDYVIVDTAPVNLVTDTLLVAKYADMFLYVVRANYLDKRLLAVPEELYRNKRLPNMSIVLNDTDPKRSYGYGYGGYGYGYLAEQEKSWFKKMFSK